ncbi:MAG TPA: DsrE family protein [Acidobacteriota bacterium]|nr:DsrE family protein [Acidobacteriota bacterium]
MESRIARFLLLLISALVLLGFTVGGYALVASTEPTPRDGVFIHISHGPEHAHRVLMGLRMATVMAEDKDVLVYFDISGVNAVLKESEDIEHTVFESSQTQIKNLIAKGVTVFVCPSCLKASKKSSADVMDGVKSAERETFLSFTQGRILSIDY